jgi:serine/threonine protein kinase
VPLADEHRTAPGALVGTPRYLSPEAAGGADAGPAADVYALGIILYEAATGTYPYQATTLVSMLRAHLADDPRPFPLSPGVAYPAEFESLVLRMLAKEPTARPTAREVLRELTRLDEEVAAEKAALMAR